MVIYYYRVTDCNISYIIINSNKNYFIYNFIIKGISVVYNPNMITYLMNINQFNHIKYSIGYMKIIINCETNSKIVRIICNYFFMIFYENKSIFMFTYYFNYHMEIKFNIRIIIIMSLYYRAYNIHSNSSKIQFIIVDC